MGFSRVLLGCIGVLATAGTAAATLPATDPATDANAEVLGEAPAVAMGNLFLATGYALSSGGAGEHAQQDLAASGLVAGVHWATGRTTPAWLLPAGG